MSKNINNNINETNVAAGSAPANTSGEDMLLEQIDAFRDKAQQLSSLIASKEIKVQELEKLVSDKELEINELQKTLAEKQEEADSLVVDMSKQVDRMIESVNGTLTDIEKRLGDQVANTEETQVAQSKEISETLGSVNTDLETMKTELSEKVHSENVKVYRNIHDLLQETDKSEENKATLISNIKSTRTVAAWALVFGIVDLAGIAGIVVLMLQMVGLI